MHTPENACLGIGANGKIKSVERRRYWRYKVGNQEIC